MESVLDSTGLRPAAQRQQFFLRCVSLEEGDSFLLRASMDPTPWLRTLEQRLPDTFGWRLVEQGTEEWIGILSRRAGAPVEGGGVLRFMTRDHQRIHGMLEQVARAAAASDWQQVLGLAAELEAALGRHFELEAQVFFPLLVERLDGQARLVESLKAEHEETYRFVQTIGRLVANMGRWHLPEAYVTRAVEGLQRVLGSHSQLEDRFLYMVTDLLLTDEDREQLLARCRSLE